MIWHGGARAGFRRAERRLFPGPGRLLEVGHARGPAVDHDLADPVEHGRRRRVMSDDSSGTWITGRSLSGMVSRGTSGPSSSISGTRYTCATSAGLGVELGLASAHATTGVMMKPERVP